MPKTIAPKTSLAKESDFWKRMKSHASPGVHWVRIENTAVSGAPDLNGCKNGVDRWVELKVMRDGRITVRHSQLLWIFKRSRIGGRSFVLVRDESARKIVLFTGVQVWVQADQLKKRLDAGEKLPRGAARVDEDGITFRPTMNNMTCWYFNDDGDGYSALEQFLFQQSSETR